MARSVKLNFIYNIALTLSTYIVSLLVFPHVSRVLGVDIIGKIGFATNVINYFSLFALWGVTTVGVREIAECGIDKEKRNSVFTNIFSIILLFTSIITILYVVCIIYVPRFQNTREIFVLGSFILFFTSLLIEWFYQGIENFRFITIRAVIIKIAYAACIFIFIKDKSDYILYFFFTTALVVVNASINLLYSRNFVVFSYKTINISKYLKPIISLGIYRILTSMYTTFNVVFLGFVSSDIEVGYYYTSTKVFYIVLGLLTAFSTVMMPRMSALLSENKKDEFDKKIIISLDIVFLIALPLVIFSIILAPQIISVLSGNGYEGAITPMRIVMLMIPITGLAQIWVMQILIPLKKDKVILYSSLFGAIIGVSANLLIVPSYGAIGSAIVILLSEIACNSVTLYYILKHNFLSFPISKLTINLCYSIPYILICSITSTMINDTFTVILVSSITCLLYFIFNSCILLKNKVVIDLLNNITHR